MSLGKRRSAGSKTNGVDFSRASHIGLRKMNKYRASIALQLCSYTALMIAAAAAASASFDCNRARYPDEYAICANSELADLDILVARGYAYLKSTQGAFAADTVGVPFWKARHACGSDLACIRQREVQARAAS